jgi:hypothetical protein
MQQEERRASELRVFEIDWYYRMTAAAADSLFYLLYREIETEYGVDEDKAHPPSGGRDIYQAICKKVNITR